MTPAEKLLQTFDAAIADTSLPLTKRRKLSRVRTTVTKIFSVSDKRGRKQTVDHDRIRELAAQQPALSNAAIARLVGCSAQTVFRVLNHS